MANVLPQSKRVELDAELAENIVDSDQAQEIAVVIRSSIIASEEIEEWKTAQEEEPVAPGTIERVRRR